MSRQPAELFELNALTIESFALEDDDAPSLLGRENLYQDINPGFGTSETVREWQPVHLSSMWKPPRAVGDVTMPNDSPGLMALPAFSRRASEALNDLLEPNGELLPLDTEKGEFYLFNITRIVDALDIDRSVCDFWCDPPTTAVGIDYFAFHTSALAGLSIFRIYEHPILTIVTDDFVQRVEKHGLRGFEFKKIWPLPAGSNWRM